MDKILDKKGKLLLGIFRFGKKHLERKNLVDKICFFLYKILNIIVGIGFFGSEIQPSATISDELYFYHPYGIIINANSVIEKGCVIRQQVTIGNKGLEDTECPQIGKNVEIGAGAKIIGGISIGDNSVIGANAVVTKTFPPNAILVGVPAKNIAKNKGGNLNASNS